MTLLLYGSSDFAVPLAELRLDPLNNRTSRVWHCRVPSGDIPGAAYYAYRVDGPHDVVEGRRFEPDKILLDPYARGVFFSPAFSRAAAMRPGANAGRAPLGVLPVAVPAFDWRADARLLGPRFATRPGMTVL